MERFDVKDKIQCRLKVDYHKDTGMGGDDVQAQVHKAATEHPAIRPCALLHAWVEKWDCKYRCEHLVHVYDPATGEVTPPDKIAGRQVIRHRNNF